MVAGTVVIVDDLPGATMVSETNGTVGTLFFLEWYEMPYTRAVPYLFGALCGYWLYQFEKQNASGKMMLKNFYEKHPMISMMYPRVLGWAVAIALALATVFDLKEYNYYGSPLVMSRVGAFFYAAFQIL